MNLPLASPGFLVSQLIPQGLHILGGAPKIGKSWLVLWLCLQIAKGEPLWNYETRQGTVLYLALEDSFERLQLRLLEIIEDAPSCLHFAVLAQSISEGLDKQIEAFLIQYPDTRFIAIDTLQNIRREDTGSNSYANDYRDLTFLKELAYKHRIAILLVHHLRKQKDLDPLNMLSGTATQLAALICKEIGVEIAPAVLSKRLLRYHSQFCGLGYTCEFGRTNQGRFIRIETACAQPSGSELGDGSDGTTDTASGAVSSVMPS